jgi:TRAP-type C4-dicarboxylate transport system substrate-binding protein
MDPISIRFGGYQGPNSVHSRAAEIFGRCLSDRLGELVRFSLDGNVTASGQSAAGLLKGVETGAFELCYMSASYLAERVPEFSLLDLPFTINDREQAYRILDGPLAQILADKLAACSGYRLLGFWDNGFRHISNRLRPIREPADCKGMRIRTLLSDLHGRVFRTLGFEPVALDVKHLVESVRNHTVDAQENPLTNFYNFAIYEHHRHLTLSGHFFGAAVLLCHGAGYTSWPAEVRQAVDEAAREATARQREFAAAEDIDVLARLNPDNTKIVRLSDPERALFVEAVAPVIDRQRAALGNDMFDYLA